MKYDSFRVVMYGCRKNKEYEVYVKNEITTEDPILKAIKADVVKNVGVETWVEYTETEKGAK